MGLENCTISNIKILLACLTVLHGLVAIAAKEFNVRSFGATGDGMRKDTVAIQKAIDECALGGGRVIVPPGTYLVGSIWLKDDVELHLQEGATLLGSADLADYNSEDAYPQNWSSKSEGWSAKHLVLAIEKRNVSITGKGVIDGNARSFFSEGPAEKGTVCWRYGYLNVRGEVSAQARPGQEIVFVECSGVAVKDVTFNDMSCWSCYFYGSRDITVGNVKIRNNITYANTDGFDVDSCTNVRIGDCDIVTGDDAIAVRGSPSRLKDKTKICENVTISNIVCRVSADGVRVGVGNGEIRNVRISDMKILSAGRGLHLQCCYGRPRKGIKAGVDISDVVFERIEISDTCTSICVAAGAEESTARLENICFRDVRAESFSGVAIVGNGATVPRDIAFERCTFKIAPSVAVPVADRECGIVRGRNDGAVRIENAGSVSFRSCNLLWSREASGSLKRAFSLFRAKAPDVDPQSSFPDR